MIPEIRNLSHQQRIQDLDLISFVQMRLRGQLIEVLKYLNEFSTASARWLFDYEVNDRTINNRAKLIVKQFNTSVAHHFWPIKITTSWNDNTKWSCKQQNSVLKIVKLIQIQLWQTLGRKSSKCLSWLVAIIDAVHNSRVNKQGVDVNNTSVLHSENRIRFRVIADWIYEFFATFPWSQKQLIPNQNCN